MDGTYSRSALDFEPLMAFDASPLSSSIASAMICCILGNLELLQIDTSLYFAYRLS